MNTIGRPVVQTEDDSVAHDLDASMALSANGSVAQGAVSSVTHTGVDSTAIDTHTISSGLCSLHGIYAVTTIARILSYLRKTLGIQKRNVLQLRNSWISCLHENNSWQYRISRCN